MIRKNIVLLVIFSCLGLQNLIGQDSTSKFYSEANGTIGDRQRVNALSFHTPNETTLFFENLEKKFGNPIKEGYFFRYNCRNATWSRRKIILRVERGIQIDLDNKYSNIVFIFVETKRKCDLLKPHTQSSENIKSYFLELFNETIKNGKPEIFKLD